MINSVLLGIIGGQEIAIILTFILIPFIIIPIIAMWKIFTKANKPGWASIVPIYSTIIFLEIIGKPWWWLLLMLIPFVNIIFIIWSWNLMSKSFGKSEGFTIGIIFLSIIFISILGFGNSKYIGPAGLKNE